MKRILGKQMLLPSLAAVAGVALGATMALAAPHKAVQLYTYEEIAQQFGYSNGRMPIAVNPQTKQGLPVSMKQSCGTAGCHVKGGIDWTYDRIQKNSFHSAEGWNEIPDRGKNWDGSLAPSGQLANTPKPWVQGGAMTGKWCNPSLRQVPNLRDVDPNTPGVQAKSYATADAFKAGVDLSIWDYTTNACGSCHPGGGFLEMDRNGNRLSTRTPDGPFDIYSHTTVEKFNPMTGLPEHTVERAPWAIPYSVGPAGTVTNPFTGAAADGSQIMMPNVKEMDCLICHFKGYNNMMSSVSIYSGMNFIATMAGSGIMDLNSMSGTYQGYNKDVVTFKDGGPGGSQFVFLNMTTLASRMSAKPDQANCKLCHIGTSLTDLPSFMSDFLAAAPMVYSNTASGGFNKLIMPSFDFNAPFGSSWDWTLGPYATSPGLTPADVGAGMMGDPTKSFAFIPSIKFPAAMGPTVYNATALAGGAIGGGNPAGTGPLYYEAMADATHADQNALKKSIVAFPRAEWFKRGDLWDGPENDLHYSFNCSGCHMDTQTTKVDQFGTGIVAGLHGDGTGGKSLCDPGRGFDFLSNTESGTISSAYVQDNTIDSRNTVKKCTNCHLTGKNDDGVTLKAEWPNQGPNPTAAHARFGLASSAVNGKIKHVRATKLDASGNEVEFAGSHIDLIDCSVCHMYRKQMVVRGLDSASGHRYPALVGLDRTKGMQGMFKSGLMYSQFDMPSEMEEWQPLYGWQKIGDALKTKNGGVNSDWRRKLYATNMVTAMLFYNEGTGVDANGDGQFGRGPTRNVLTPASADGSVAAVLDEDHGNHPYAENTWIDAWVQRDLKAGFNFGPGGFAPIPVGFGSGTFASAYDAEGKFTGSWKYVGIYGGNVMLTQFEEVEAFFAHREAIKDQVDGKSWAHTKSLYSGVPFQMTHGIVPTSKHVLGKSCTDCHAPNAKAQMFSGGYDMIGLGIETSVGAKFMERPATEMTIIYPKDKLVTSAEVGTREGKSREVPFETLGCYTTATKHFAAVGTEGCLLANTNAKRVEKLNRSVSLYPDMDMIKGVDGVERNRTDHINYLQTIGAVPTPAYGLSFPTTATIGVPITLSATEANGLSGSNLVYTWAFEDGTSLTGNPVSKTFTSAGKKRVSLYITNTNTGKKVGVPDPAATQPNIYLDKFITVSPAAPTGTFTAGTPSISGNTVTLNLSGMPAHTSIQVRWGDTMGNGVTSTSSTYKTSTATFSKAKHTYPAAGPYTAKIYLYNGNTLVARNENVVINVTDSTAPAAPTFELVSGTSLTLTVPVKTFKKQTADTDVAGYIITESATAPAVAATGWTATAPATYTFANGGTKTLYAYVKDAAGNVSPASAVQNIIVDAAAPVITFTVPATVTALTVNFTTLSATDDTAVTGYLVRESAATPALSEVTAVSAPTSFTFATAGAKTLYAWAKDGYGRLTLKTASVTITLP